MDSTQLTIDDIRTSVQAWKSLVANSDNAKLIDLFVVANGNSFIYEVKTYPLPCTQLHLYPAVYKGLLYFFVIPKEYDTAAYAKTINKYVVACPVGNFLQGNQIPDLEAQARINRWANNYPTWIPWQNNKTDKVFLAFQLDMIDFESDRCNVTLGLTLDPDPDRADLIVTNYLTDTVEYDDAAGVVPPFGPSATSSSFYLLSM